MKNTLSFLLLVGCFCVLLFFIFEKDSVTMSTPVSSGSTFYLNAEEVKDMTLRADNGDKEAAFRLYQYYEFSVLDDEQSIKWLEKSAGLAHEVAQYNFVKSLLDQGREMEAADWVRRANSQGVHVGNDALALLNPEDKSQDR
ncbi:hypothetical protein CO614_03350 [Lysobacteraceae bacterium NML120232]|nr:hypothetical protein CO608_00140 [Xanthomonadaceae bacterium NML08-0793]PJK12791.1 hypothetical protein CO614_03350 [Xanthomonadaceae bacterium NML120232]